MGMLQSRSISTPKITFPKIAPSLPDDAVKATAIALKGIE